MNELRSRTGDVDRQVDGYELPPALREAAATPARWLALEQRLDGKNVLSELRDPGGPESDSPCRAVAGRYPADDPSRRQLLELLESRRRVRRVWGDRIGDRGDDPASRRVEGGGAAQVHIAFDHGRVGHADGMQPHLVDRPCDRAHVAPGPPRYGQANPWKTWVNHRIKCRVSRFRTCGGRSYRRTSIRASQGQGQFEASTGGIKHSNGSTIRGGGATVGMGYPL